MSSDSPLLFVKCFYSNFNPVWEFHNWTPMHFEFDMWTKVINSIAKNNCVDEINWPNHLRVIKVIKFTKAKSQ